MSLVSDVECALNWAPIALEYISITPYYQNVEQNRKDAAVLESWRTNVYALAYKFKVSSDEAYRNKGIQLLDFWVSSNNGAANDEGNLYLVYKGHFFISAAFLMNYSNDAIKNWISNVYIPACNKLKDKWNNRGMWALHGLYVANKFLGIDNSSIVSATIKHIKRASWKIPFISNKNELWTENLRNNSGMEYTCFYLMPALAITIDSKNSDLKDLLIPLLDKFFEYCVDPDKWTYKALPSFLGKIQRLIFTSKDKLSVPLPSNWAGTLVYVYGTEFRNRDCVIWAGNDFFDYADLFRYYKEF